MMGLEFSFIKRIIKGKFTFGQILFKQSINFVRKNKNFQGLIEKWFKIKNFQTFNDEDFLEAHNFVVP
jgi:hypothetical protein